MSMPGSFWSGLFELLGRGLDFVGGLVKGKPAEPSQPLEDAAAARSGTASGSAGHEAGHIVEGGE